MWRDGVKWGGGCGEGVRVILRVWVRAGTARPYVTSKFVWGKLYFHFATTGAFLCIFAPAPVAHKQQCSARRSVGALLVGLQRRRLCCTLSCCFMCWGCCDNVWRGLHVAPLLWFLLSRACVVHSVAIYIPIHLGTRPAGVEKGHAGPEQ